MKVNHDLPGCSLKLRDTFRNRSKIWKATTWLFFLALAGMFLFIGTACGTTGTAGGLAVAAKDGKAQAEDVRAKALAALQTVAAWQVKTTSSDGWVETEWWSANSGNYRWDETVAGKKRSSLGTDGKVLIAPGPDGAVVDQPLGPAAGRLPTSTVFTTYYSYLKQGKPVTVGQSSDGTLRLVLKDAPSSLSAVLDTNSYLPSEFLGKSEETGAAGGHFIQLSPISSDDLAAAISELRNTPSPTRADVTPKDHLVNALRAAGIDCYRADTYTNPEKERGLELSIQAPIGEAGHALAEKAVSLVRENRTILPVDSVTIYLLTVTNEFYSETFTLDSVSSGP